MDLTVGFKKLVKCQILKTTKFKSIYSLKQDYNQYFVH